MEFNQEISNGDLKKAIAIHYFSYKYTYISPVLGSILLVLSSVILVLIPHDISKGLFICLLAVLLLLRPVFYVNNVFKSFTSGKVLSNKIAVRVDDNQIITTFLNGNSISVNLRDLYCYNTSKSFIFLYVARNQYVIVDKRQMPPGGVGKMLTLLSALNIQKK